MVRNLFRTKIAVGLTIVLAIGLFLLPTFFSLDSGLHSTYALAADNEATYAPSEAARNLGLTDWNVTIFSVLSSLGFFVAYIGGNMLDVSAGVFTVHMYSVVEYFSIDNSIEASWAIVRDLFNLFFIFGIVLVGFKLILNIDENGSKKTLGSIIVAALLINFSLYATQLLVDFSNVLSYQISQLMTTTTTDTLFEKDYPEISNGFLNLSGASVTVEDEGLEGIRDEAIFAQGIDNPGTAMILGLLFMIFYMILGFVFAAGAIILFTRFIALIALMIFSPIFFIGMVLPYFKSLGDAWQKHFVGNLIVGPVYLFMLYVSLRSLSGLGGVTGEFSMIGFIFQLLIVAGFLLASLKIAKEVGAFGANQAQSISRNLTRRYGRVVAGGLVGGSASLLRNTAGRRAQKASESTRLRELEAKGGLRGWVARQQLTAARKLGDSSFDARKVGGVGGKLGVGEGYKGGYKTRTEDIAKLEKERAERLGTIPDDDERVSALQIDVDATEQSIKNKKGRIQELEQSKKDAKEEDRSKIQAEIDAIKSEVEVSNDDLKKQKENLSREKQRLQLGSETNVNQSVLDTRKELKDKLANKLQQYAEASAENKDAAREEVAKTKKELAEIEDKINAAAGGYAVTVNDFNAGLLAPVKNFFRGRTAEQNTNASKKVREEYQKKVKTADNDNKKDKKEGAKKSDGGEKKAA